MYHCTMLLFSLYYITSLLLDKNTMWLFWWEINEIEHFFLPESFHNHGTHASCDIVSVEKLNCSLLENSHLSSFSTQKESAASYMLT